MKGIEEKQQKRKKRRKERGQDGIKQVNVKSGS